MKQVLGTPIGAPPPGAEATALPPATADLDTNRKQVDAQTTGGVCDRPATTATSTRPASRMEAFNAVGTWQTEREASTGVADRHHLRRRHRRRRRPRHGPRRPDGEARRLADGAAPLRGAVGLVRLRTRGRPDGLLHGQRLSTKIAAGGYTVLNLITDLTQSPSFRPRAVGGDLMNRRVFLKGIGGAAVAAPFLPSVYEQKASGARRRRRRPSVWSSSTPTTAVSPTGGSRRSTNGALTADALAGGTLQPLTPYISEAARPARIQVAERVRGGPDDRPARSGHGLEAHLRDDRLRRTSGTRRRPRSTT